MSFGWIAKFRHTLAFRLTLWYAAIFILLANIAFLLFYLLITSAIHQRTDADLLAQANQLRAIYTLQDLDTLQRTALLQAQATGEKKMFFRLFYPSGVVFASSNMSYWGNIGIDRRAVDSILHGATQIYTTLKVPQHRHQARIIYARVGSSIIMQMGYSLEGESNLLQAFKQIFLVSMTALLLLAVVVGWFMARRALSGVESLTRTARQISEDDLDTRVPVRHRLDEIDGLAVTFNQMLDRIQVLITGVSQMNDNIAHDLRSPITRIRGLAEVTLTSGQSMEEFRIMAGNTIEECDRLLDMINTMLAISSTEAGVNPLRRSDVDLATLVGEACELFRPLAEDKQIQLHCHLPELVHIKGDQRMLQRLVANLVDNAIKYTPGGGQVNVSLKLVRPRQACLTVSDTGIGIATEDQSRVFDRFFRSDQSRAKAGAGLGLSLAKAVARAHGGEIHLQSHVNLGSSFTVWLPAA